MIDVEYPTGNLSQYYWPENWFGTWRFYNSSNNSLNGQVLEYGWWFYDFPNQFLRMDNTLSFCHNPNGTGFVFCEGVFLGNQNGSFYLYAPELTPPVCCLCIPDVGLTPPNWIDNFENNTKVVLNVLYQPFSILSNLVIFNASAMDNKQSYFQSVLSGNPVAMSGDPATDTTADQWDDVTVGEIPTNANNLPGGGSECNVPCPSAFHCKFGLDSLFERRPILRRFLHAL